MDQSEYLKMIKDSAVFEYLSAEFKENAMNARGDDMARYAAVFADAQAALGKADEDLRAANVTAVKEYKMQEKSVEKKMNTSVENKVRDEEEKRQESLLEEIKNT